MAEAIPLDIEKLICLLHEGRIDAQQAERLSAWISASQAHAVAYHQYIVEERILEVSLRELQIRNVNRSAGHENDDVLDALVSMEADAPILAVADLTDRMTRRGVFGRKQPLAAENPSRRHRVIVIPHAVVYGSLAAVLLLAMWVGYAMLNAGGPPASPQNHVDQPGSPTPDPPVVLARVTLKADAVVTTSQNQPAGQELVPGVYRFSPGLVGLRMDDGSEVVVQGPAEITLHKSGGMTLNRGRVVAKVPPEAIGFTIWTPDATIVDYGTEFGVWSDAASGTEVHVFEGEVSAAAKDENGEEGLAIRLRRDEAASVGTDRHQVELIRFAGERFERRVVKRLDLVDIVAGGDGTTARRDIGLNPSTGGYSRHLGGRYNMVSAMSDGRIHRVPASTLLGGVFIPDRDGEIQGMPAGYRLPVLPATTGRSYGLIWCGGVSNSTVDGHDAAIPVQLGGIDYAEPGRQALTMHANAGVLIDLDAVRAAYPGYRVSAFRGRLGLTAPAVEPGAEDDQSCEFIIALDDQVVSHNQFQWSMAPENRFIDFTVQPEMDDRFLVLASCDGGNSRKMDWLILGDPQLILEPLP